MKLRLLLSTLLIFVSFWVKAQDTIHRIDGNIIVGQVTEVSSAEIKYKRSSNGSGPVYVLKATEVSKIIYADGRSDVFVREKKASPSSTPTRSANTSSSSKASNRAFLSENGIRRKHFIGINVTDLLPGLISLSYEANIYKDLVSLRVPISLGLSGISGIDPDYIGYPDFYYYSRNKVFSTGLDLRYYPAGQNFSSYFVGLTWEYGQVSYIPGGYSPFPTPPNLQAPVRTWFNSVGVVNGVLIQATEQLNISMYLSIGTQVSGLDGQNGYRAMLRGGLVLGWRFGNSTDKPRTGSIKLSE